MMLGVLGIQLVGGSLNCCLDKTEKEIKIGANGV